ncbi:helix-turn-helix transcriptional regulator [Alicyclobacillus acidocaldarius]|uniref:HTH cro/C1-type domain-containing protein n=1 Tax=Alicyclobacillus acidocaldarius (strain Tc-4-1) TaxID=1048834 RepID=F8IDF7_ALIAT|nr:helix-turn-helix transcriptional regulator [Alicyclobacillus acidocaldarius]AEJ43810.1 hypothetical protein TC41_1894 [Alicyclobacillus acidocaldarius subsp. acidocaldarius Tc-4-1]
MLGSVLKTARRAKGMTQQEVADSAGIHVRTYQNYESNKRCPTLDVAARLSDILGVDVRDLAQRQSRSA